MRTIFCQKSGFDYALKQNHIPEHLNRNYSYIFFFWSVVRETTDIRTIDNDDVKKCFNCNTLLFNVKDMLMNARLRRHWLKWRDIPGSGSQLPLTAYGHKRSTFIMTLGSVLAPLWQSTDLIYSKRISILWEAISWPIYCSLTNKCTFY